MKVVITGTTGFVGTNVKAFLASKDYEIVALDRTQGQGSFTFGEISSPICRGAVWIHLTGKSKDVQAPALLAEYLTANVELTKTVFQAFIDDVTASTFIYFSSVKAAAAKVEGVLTEADELEVDVPYGLSKRLAEKYLLGITLPPGKRLIIIRPTMIYGPNSTGNLFSLFSFIKKGIPYPFSAFSNSRSLLSIDNLNYVILKIINDPGFHPGIYNVADDGVISTNEIIDIIGRSLAKKPFLLPIPRTLIAGLASVGEKLHLPFNKKVVGKLTENYVVSNAKLVAELGCPLPFETRNSLEELFRSLAARR
jgi:nucleoside-diphosphate-sugar epimerase